MVKKLRRVESIPTAVESTSKKESTVVWGNTVESGDFLKVPRALLRLPRYNSQIKLKPRHLLLLLALASRKFKTKKIRVYWEELAEDLGVNKDTVRKWAYELRDRQLLGITPHRGRDPEHNRVGHRNERNSFDLTPFVQIVEKAHQLRLKDRGKDDG